MTRAGYVKAGAGVIVALVLAGLAVWLMWDRIAVMAAPEKRAVTERSPLAIKADELFWSTFHGGDYEGIDRALEALTAAYLETPGDAKTASHIAWLHNWSMAERSRLGATPATVTDHTLVARRYFAEAVKLDPSDARTRGFLAGHTIIEGALHKDEKLVREGYFMMRDAIDAWPEFNMFTGGFVFSRLPADNPQFKEGLEWQWRALDACIGQEIDRENPDYTRYLSLETTVGPKRACWNSWIAPHNLEGFFLNMGDMLVKAGDWRTAQKIYANAKLLKSYAAWEYREALQARIDHAEENVASFNAPEGARATPMMINSDFACMACHRQ
jgi:hypothetical protein